MDRRRQLVRLAENLCLQSENFGTTWAATGTPTRSAAAHTASGVTLDLLGDDDAGVLEGYTQTVSFRADGAKALSCYVKADTSTSTNINLWDTTASLHRVRGVLTWSGGLPVVTLTVGAYLGYETHPDGVFRLLYSSAPVAARNNNLVRIWPATDAAFAATGTGAVYIGGVQAEDNPVPGRYLKTTTLTRRESR